MASRTIGRAGRAYIARRSQYILRRKKMRYVKSTRRGERLGSQARTSQINGRRFVVVYSSLAVRCWHSLSEHRSRLVFSYTRGEKERLERLEWEKAERTADQHVTVRHR